MIELLKVVVWPATIIFLLFRFQEPITAVLMAIGQRATRVKVFEFEVELSELVPASPVLNASAEILKQAVVQESGMQLMIAGIKSSARADYALIALGADSERAWLTSRLFLFSALLDRNRAARCIVFTGESGTFIGVAAPRDVRASLGARFPEYERALLVAYGQEAVAKWDLSEFRDGELSETALNKIARLFLDTVSTAAGQPKSTSWPQETDAGWVHINRSGKGGNAPSTWELAEYVTAGGLQTLLGDKLGTGRVIGVASPAANEAIARAIIEQPGTFVAFVSEPNKFIGLCDRTIIADKVARSAASQAVSA